MKNRETIHALIYLFLSIGIVATLPFSQRMCSLAIALMALNWVVEGNFRRKFELARKSTLIKLVLLFALVHLLSLFYTADLSRGLFTIEVRLAIFILPVVIGTIPAFSERQFRKILIVFAGSCVMALLLSIFLALTAPVEKEAVFTNFDYFTAEKYVSFFSDRSMDWNKFSYVSLSKKIHISPNYFAMYLLFSMFLVMYFLMEKPNSIKPIHKVLATALILFLAAAIVLLSSRIVILAMVILTIIGIWYFLWVRRFRLGTIICLIIIGIISGLVFGNPVTNYRMIKEPGMVENNFSSSPEWNSMSLRILEWKASFSIIIENPIFGVGIGDSKDKLNAYYHQNADLGPFDINYNSHNEYLQTAIALGLLGLGIFLAIVFLPAWHAYQRGDILSLVFIFIVSFCFLTESMLLRQKGVAFFSFFLPLLMTHSFVSSKATANA